MERRMGRRDGGRVEGDGEEGNEGGEIGRVERG